MVLGEGEFAGGLTARDIYLDGTPLQNADGSENFSGVVWEFRPGTQAQDYIQGIPGTENEISVGTEISSETSWTHTFTNTQLSAVRLRLKWPSLFKQQDNGDLVGYSINYVVELQMDGGSWQQVLDTNVTGKTTSGYERSHRIDLPKAGSTWTIRLRKITADANSAKIGDTMTLQSYTEVIDAKLRYPNTALLYIEFDSSQFNGSIPQIACEPRGRVIRVTANSSPIALQARKTAALQGKSGFNTKVTHTFPAGQPVVAFVHCTVEVEITQTISGNTITIDFLRPNATGTAYVYFFSIFPQTKPDYGLAVWDASGTLILTNETRTLSDVVTLGTAGVDASSGYNINTTLAGKWACMPAMLGLITGVISAGGQPQPYMAIYKSMAKLEGSNTRIFARPQTTPGGNLQNVAYSNLRNVIMAINCANYD